MVQWDRDKTRTLALAFARAFLSRVRKLVRSAGLDPGRLPLWITGASVKIGRLPTSLILAVDDSPARDSFSYAGKLSCDLQLLVGCAAFEPRAASLQARKERDASLTLLVGDYRDRRSTVLKLCTEHSSLFDAGYGGYHSPTALMNLFVQLAPGASTEGSEREGAATVAMRFLPFALYVHEVDLGDLGALWARCSTVTEDVLRSMCESEIGTSYQSQSLVAPHEVFQATKQTSVIVLGGYHGRELDELCQVRDYLRSRGYDARLISELPEVPMTSIEEKVRLWTLASRFSVMVDRSPAGHIAEYQILKSQGSVLALLRPVGGRSTYMMGNNHFTDVNFINLFEFEQTALHCLDDAVAWAEEFVAERGVTYDALYPWRRRSPPAC